MKNAVVGLGGVFLAVIGAWLIMFRTTPPCDGLRSEAATAMRDAKPEVRQAVLEATSRMSTLQCAIVAMRLKLGDRSALSVQVVEK